VKGARELAASLLCAGLCACTLTSSESSCEYPTDEISIVAVALDAGESIRAEIDFEAGDRSSLGIELHLCEGDVLEIEGESPVETVHPDRVVYSLTFDALASDRDIEFALDRAGDDDVTLGIALPPAFDIVAPVAAAQVSRSADFVLEWAPPQPEGLIRIGLAEEIGYGICLRTDNPEHDYKSADGVEVADDGNWLIPADVVQSDDGGACEATYDLTRVAAAAYPGGFASGGYAEGRVARSVAFVSVP
jgi:hypothetical protein